MNEENFTLTIDKMNFRYNKLNTNFLNLSSHWSWSPIWQNMDKYKLPITTKLIIEPKTIKMISPKLLLTGLRAREYNQHGLFATWSILKKKAKLKYFSN